MATPHLEHLLAHGRLHDVHDPARVFFLIKTLQHQVRGSGSLIVDKVEVLSFTLDHEGICGLADLALEGLPEIGDVVITVFHVLLCVEPLHETIQVDVADTACALARTDKWILVTLGARGPTESTLWDVYWLLATFNL